MNASKKSLQIAYLAVILALMFLFALFPFVFLVPLIIAAILLGGTSGLIASVFFGGISILYAYTNPSSVVALAFIDHPWLAIVPRLPLGVICFAVYKLGLKMFNGGGSKFKNEVLPVCFAATAASLSNTVLVVGSMAIFYGNNIYNETALMLAFPTMLLSGAIEIVAVNIIVPSIIWALRKTPAFKNTYSTWRFYETRNEMHSERIQGD